MRITGSELGNVWGEFIDEVGERRGGWDMFGTLTFRDRSQDEVQRLSINVVDLLMLI